MVLPSLADTSLSYRRQQLWYVAAVIRAAPSLPNETARAALGCAGASLGFWLLELIGSYWAVGMGLLVLMAAGFVAGWRTAWLAVPAGVWMFNAAFVAADCSPQCGEGRVGPSLDRAVLLTVPLVALAELGACAELLIPLPRFARNWGVALVTAAVAGAAVGAELAVVAGG